MDALLIPAGGRVDTTALIVGDCSDGNDAAIIKVEGDLKSLAAKPVNQMELTVSHCLRAHAGPCWSVRRRPSGVINTSDAGMILGSSTDGVEAVVT